jgi:hypothetical protein
MRGRVAILLLLALFLLPASLAEGGQSANRRVTVQSGTVLYAAGRRVGFLVREGAPATFIVRTYPDGAGVGYVTISSRGYVYVDEPYSTVTYGYARIRKGGSWSVKETRATHPVRTIGTVRRQRSGVWNAYRGLGSTARLIGHATGLHPGFGAVALLLLPVSVTS